MSLKGSTGGYSATTRVEYIKVGLVTTLWQCGSLGQNFWLTRTPKTKKPSTPLGLQTTWYPISLSLYSTITTTPNLIQWQKRASITQWNFRNPQGWTSSRWIGHHNLTEWLPGAKILERQTTHDKNSLDSTGIKNNLVLNNSFTIQCNPNKNTPDLMSEVWKYHPMELQKNPWLNIQ